jgi:predicted ATPase/DNA-binding winged helix-turn-helix (wHTH) protein
VITTHPELRIGRFRLLAEQRKLLDGDESVALSARALDLLVALVERQGRVVSKDELLDLVWPGVVVEENNLQVHVSALRKVLGAEAIQTISGRGYRITVTAEAAHTPVPALRAQGGALPRPLTSFVGREGDLETLVGLLASSRLLTLTGIGGCGKTRLAIELARRLTPRYPDGVRFVDLAPFDSPDRVPSEVARAAGVAGESVRPIADALASQLATRRMLLVLDNCEHLLDACATLVERLLVESEHLQVIATSSEALGVSGEQIVQVRSLSRPPAGASIAAALESEAVQLFIKRARLVVPEFALNANNVKGVVEICHRLDGIPLAIEMAAGRLRVLSVEQLRDKLGDRFRLLTAGNRAVSRHQTLHATFQWSYDLLTPEEQALLRRVSVFAGGWTLEAAQEIAAQGASEIDVVDRLERLVDKSLITLEHLDDGSTRYAMLETVRHFAQERLQESGEAVAVHDAHLDYFLRFADEARTQLSEQTAATLARVHREIGNIMAAHAWCGQAHVAPERGLELAIRLRRVWLCGRLVALGLQVFEEALGRPGAKRSTAVRAEALFSLGQHLHFSGRHVEALLPLSQALALARQHDAKEVMVFCLDKLAGAYLRLGRHAEARACAEEAVSVAGANPTPATVRVAFFSLGEVCRYEGQYPAAAAAYEQSSRAWGQGDIWNNHKDLGSHVCLAIAQGEMEHAGELMIKSIRTVLQSGQALQPDQDVEIASHLAAATGAFVQAARFQGAANALADRAGEGRHFWRDPLFASLSDRSREALGPGAYEAAVNAGYELDPTAAVNEVLAWLGEPPGIPGG